jgi:uncharacterized protein with PIN domain
LIENIEVKILSSGKAAARRKDGLPLTEADHALARQLADNLNMPSQKPGITVADVLRVFPGSRIVEQPIDQPKPSCCPHCDKDSVPASCRGGKVIQRVEADGTRCWACHYCGRRINSKTKRVKSKTRTTK